MTEKFTPPPEQLPPLAELMALADVTEEDVAVAAKKWRENPPDEEFQNILDAEEED